MCFQCMIQTRFPISQTSHHCFIFIKHKKKTLSVLHHVCLFTNVSKSEVQNQSSLYVCILVIMLYSLVTFFSYTHNSFNWQIFCDQHKLKKTHMPHSCFSTFIHIYTITLATIYIYSPLHVIIHIISYTCSHTHTHLSIDNQALNIGFNDKLYLIFISESFEFCHCMNA